VDDLLATMSEDVG